MKLYIFLVAAIITLMSLATETQACAPLVRQGGPRSKYYTVYFLSIKWYFIPCLSFRTQKVLKGKYIFIPFNQLYCKPNKKF